MTERDGRGPIHRIESIVENGSAHSEKNNGAVNEVLSPEYLPKLRVSVVIPAKNEEESLPEILPRVPKWVHEVILVDGLSVDGTKEVAKLHLPNIVVVEQTGRGKGNALKEGFAHTTGDITVAMDADGSMEPEEIPEFAKYIDLLGYDYVKGSRMLPGGSSTDLTNFRRFGNWAFRTLTNVKTGSRYSDLCYGYFAFRNGTIDTMDLRSDGFEIETEINIRAFRAGLKIAEIPSNERERTYGTSNLNSFRDGARILKTIFVMSFKGRDVLSELESSVPMTERSVSPAVVPLLSEAEESTDTTLV